VACHQCSVATSVVDVVGRLPEINAHHFQRAGPSIDQSINQSINVRGANQARLITSGLERCDRIRPLFLAGLGGHRGFGGGFGLLLVGSGGSFRGLGGLHLGERVLAADVAFLEANRLAA
jgi:hypothetical protein